MKKTIATALALLAAVSMTACGTTPAVQDTTLAATTTQATTSAETPPAATTSAETPPAETAPATTAAAPETQPAAAPEDDIVTEIADVVEDDYAPDMITGTLYGPYSDEYILEMDFGYEAGTCTPAKIADALSAWTGLNYDITYTADEEAVYIDWTASSSLATGQPAEEQLEDFTFYDAYTLRWFMLNSMASTVLANMDVQDVYYSVDGGDLNDLELDQDFNPAFAFNDLEGENVVIA
jgi:hypothetical protein